MLGESKSQDRFPVKHNDMLGKLQSATSGGTVWSLEAITGTTFIIGALADSNDVVQITIQIPHTRKLGTVLDSIHIHYVTQSATNAGDTTVFSGSYVWIQPGDVIPASASWIAMSGAGLTLTHTAHAAAYYGLHTIQTNVTCPAGANEGYGGMLLISITHTSAGSYAGKIGILDVDAHSQVDRLGSTNEASE